MNARQEAKLSMLEAVADLPNQPYWSTALSIAPIMTTYAGNIAGYVGQIQVRIPDSIQSTIPVSTNKLELRRDMEFKIASVAGMGYAYAVDALNTRLAETLKPWRKKSALAKLKDNETNAIGLIVYNALVGIDSADLVPYGMIETVPASPPDPEIPGTLDSMLLAVSAYTDVIETPEVAIETRKTVNGIINNYFDLADETLELMDSVVYEFQFDENTIEFYNQYKNARVIFDPVTTSTGFRGTVTDGFTLLPIQGIKVTATPATIDPPGEAGVPVETFTDVNGYYTLATPQYKNNPYALRFLKAGYETFIKNDLYQQRGKKQTIDVPMIPITP